VLANRSVGTDQLTNAVKMLIGDADVIDELVTDFGEVDADKAAAEASATAVAASATSASAVAASASETDAAASATTAAPSAATATTKAGGNDIGRQCGNACSERRCAVRFV
jgi:hypothetical protein